MQRFLQFYTEMTLFTIITAYEKEVTLSDNSKVLSHVPLHFSLFQSDIKYFRQRFSIKELNLFH